MISCEEYARLAYTPGDLRDLTRGERLAILEHSLQCPECLLKTLLLGAIISQQMLTSEERREVSKDSNQLVKEDEQDPEFINPLLKTFNGGEEPCPSSHKSAVNPKRFSAET